MSLFFQGSYLCCSIYCSFIDHFVCSNAIPAKLTSGDRIIVYMGIIDVLQSYRLKKKLEHSFKALVHDGVDNCVNVESPIFICLSLYVLVCLFVCLFVCPSFR